MLSFVFAFVVGCCLVEFYFIPKVTVITVAYSARHLKHF